MQNEIAGSQPLIYDFSYEVLEEDEAETEHAINKALLNISETTFKNSGHAMRSVHAKSHGFLIGEIKVLENLPAYLQQGMFANSVTLPLVMRFSTPPGDLLDDKVSLPRGLSIKIVGVEGSRLSGSEDANTQDFVLVNGPVFSSANAKKFLPNIKMLAASTDKVPNLKRAFSSVLQATEKVIEAVGSESPKIKTLGGHPETHLLGETFFSQAPILFGQYMAKVCVAPVSASLTQLKDQQIDLTDRPDGLRELVSDYFAQNHAQWELRVQLCTDLENMSIEDSSVEWSEDLSPYVAVATITAQPQSTWNDNLVKEIDKGMSFSPWHGLEAHRPIGSIMRARKMAYEMSARFRSDSQSGVPVVEPNNLDHLVNT